MYYEILVKNALPSGNRLIGEGFYFRNDNDFKHTSKLGKKCLKQKEKDGKLKILY